MSSLKKKNPLNKSQNNPFRKDKFSHHSQSMSSVNLAQPKLLSPSSGNRSDPNIIPTFKMTPAKMLMNYSGTELQTSHTFNKASELIMSQKKMRKKIEHLLPNCKDCAGFQHTLSKSNEIIRFLIKDNWLKNKSGVAFLERVIELEKSLVLNVKQTIQCINQLKSDESELKASKKSEELLKKEKDRLERELGFSLRRQRPNKNVLANQQRLWNKERAELEERIESLTLQLMNKDSREATPKHMISQNAYQIVLHEFKMKKKELRSIITKLQFELGRSKEEILEKDKTISKLQSTIDKELKEAYNKMHDEAISILSERVNMQQEEIASLCFYKVHSFKQKENIEKLQLLLTKYEDSKHLEELSEKNAHSYINYNDPIFSVFSSLEKFRYDNNHKEIVKKENLKFIEYTYHKPSFAALLNIPCNHKLPVSASADLWLEVTIRAILDSKYTENQTLLHENISSSSSFSEFVYEWMSCFYVDSLDKSIKEIEWWKKNTKTSKLTLLSALSHIKSHKIWEIHTFREMLNEEISTDELCFYLEIRNRLFRGPQMSAYEGKSRRIHYVTLNRMFDLADSLVSSRNILNEIKMILSQKAQSLKGETHLDSALGLRVLLEYYKYDKHNKIKTLKTEFENSFSSESIILFDTFSSFFRNINDSLTDGQLIRAFRESWALGKSKITYEGIITVANELGYFYKPCYFRKDRKTNPSEIYEDWKNSKVETSLLKAQIVSLGIPSTLNTLKILENYIENIEHIQSPETLYKKYWAFYINLLILVDSENSLSSGQVKDFVGGFLAGVKDEKLERLKLVSSIRKIQRFLRLKKL